MITGHTRVVALLGSPVRHSRSPALHNAWFARAGIDAVYVALEAPLDTDAAAMVRGGLWGANLTIPFKRTVLDRLDGLDTDARATGAVNTLYRDGHRLLGANTDVDGWATDALRHTGLTGRRAVILGAGGAAIAVGHALGKHGAERVHFANRSPADAVVARLAPHAPQTAWSAGPLTPDAIADADLVVHALPAAARPTVEALAFDRLAPTGTWFDLNYFDASPPGFATVQARGWQTVDGHGMLEEQAALAFARWTGRLPPREAPCEP